jgi:polysaccharide biosynthesis transport protein
MIAVEATPLAHAVRGPSLLDSARRHVLLVLVGLLVGLGLGWVGASGQSATWTSTARVLVNPTVGNPFAPVPSSVRQDELTSLETEAQVAGSTEVLSVVANENPPLTIDAVRRGTAVVVPANTQILELTFTASDPDTAEAVANSLADTYLSNRTLRGTNVNQARINKVEDQTKTVVDDLRAATAAAQKGTKAERLFQSELASALRNQLVSLRAQRSYLESSDAPSGSVISTASPAVSSGGLGPIIFIVVGALLGLALGCVGAFARERFAGRVRSRRDLESHGMPVALAAPTPRRRVLRRGQAIPADDTIRRLRAHVLGTDPRPEIIAVAPADAGAPAPGVAAALAASFARAGHRVVLVHAGEAPTGKNGLADTLVLKGVRVVNLLQPSTDPLMTLISWSLTEDNRDRFSPANLRAALAPVVDSGRLVVLETPDVTSVEGEAILEVADLALVVVTLGHTRTRRVVELAGRARTPGAGFDAVLVDEATAARSHDLDSADDDLSDRDDEDQPMAEAQAQSARFRQ